MKYVYILQSILFPDNYYTGVTKDINKRLQYHNYGQSPYSAKFKPWKLVTYIAFSDLKKAHKFERYLKSGSGRAFAQKHLR
ncbi:MAG: GIY-YIG nuclease family protein [Candidatus Marinimicrobia bacterium]|nr:GIY-YIG nuclease family protein [Candidatus Neomarinimicrobiota bacterium]